MATDVDPAEIWLPANQAELIMYHALLRADPVRYFQTVAGSMLYIAGVTEPSRRLVTWDRGGRPHLLAFTSPEGLARCLGPDAQEILPFSYPDLLQQWPNPAWWLAINPTLPIDATVPPEFVGSAARGETDGGPVADLWATSGFDAVAVPFDREPTPANELEQGMVAVLAEGNTALLLDLLVWAEVLLPTQRPVDPEADLRDPAFPWLPVPISPDESALAVFTSPERLAEAAAGDAVPTVKVPMLDVVLGWPGPEYTLLVNPESALTTRLPGEQVAGLLDWARVSALYHDIDVTR